MFLEIPSWSLLGKNLEARGTRKVGQAWTHKRDHWLAQGLSDILTLGQGGL